MLVPFCLWQKHVDSVNIAITLHVFDIYRCITIHLITHIFHGAPCRSCTPNECQEHAIYSLTKSQYRKQTIHTKTMLRRFLFSKHSIVSWVVYSVIDPILSDRYIEWSPQPPLEGRLKYTILSSAFSFRPWLIQFSCRHHWQLTILYWSQKSPLWLGTWRRRGIV